MDATKPKFAAGAPVPVESLIVSSELDDLVVIGGNAGGLSTAVAGRQAGLARVRVIEPGRAMALPGVIGEYGLDASYGESITSIDLDGEALVVTTSRQTYRTHAVLVAQRQSEEGWEAPIAVPSSDRILIDTLPEHPSDTDVLVVGYTDHAVELTAALADLGAGVVLAAGGMDPTRLSPVADAGLRKLEKERQATLLYRSVPSQLDVVNGFPMAYFGDRRTPDLQFDYIVLASGRDSVSPASVGATEAARGSGRMWFMGEAEEIEAGLPSAPSHRVARELIEACFPTAELPPLPSPLAQRREHAGVIDELREENYNATITHFEPTHSDLWVLRIRPDHGSVSHLPGQYASLGLGYWEDRIDDAVDPGLDERWDKMVRRSYSISHRIFEGNGYLAGDTEENELEFYIVLVPPTDGNVPGLTPRLALKRPGDRIYLGPKVAGRYTLAPVDDPASSVLLLSTGTGEAPHNAMVTQLLRKGHYGSIVSVVSVRQWADLGYRKEHETLQSRYPNYRYLPLPTRESDVPKRYIQDVLSNGELEPLGIDLDPNTTNVFLCGNPAMIGLPEETDGETKFPEVTGVVEILSERGFTLDRRGSPGNIHFEEYW